VRKWLIPGSLALAVPIVALLLPYAAGAHHLEAGGRALDAALGEIDALNWWYVGPIEIQDHPELDEAIAHLEQATRYTQALRLLGRAHAARGDLLSSIEALERFTAQRPENPMGHLELAAAYVRADQRLQGMYSVDLLEALPGVQVRAPDLPGVTPYQPEGWHSEYAYPTAYLLPPDEEERPTLFLHAGSQVTYTLTLTQPAVLSFGMGLDPRSLDWGGDGVTFEVWVDGTRAFMEHLPVEVARAGWQVRQVDLGAYVGQTVALSLVSTPGPAGDVTADWAGWGAPRVEEARAAGYREAVRGEPWLRAWKVAKVGASDFIRAGESARKTQRHEEALAWYKWAMQVDLELGDPWYYVGLLYEDQERWEEALAAYERATTLGGFRQVHRSSPYYRTGLIYQWHLNPRQTEMALTAYEAAIREGDFGSNREAADCHHRRGEILWGYRANLTECIAEYRQAIELDPEFAPAHILLGVAYYDQYRDMKKAEAEIGRALELNPQAKWAYYHLGEIYRQEGRLDRAKKMYSRALVVAPGFDAAESRLAALEGGN
jgi:tetratricopeptide (TPR) repeat protein